MEYVTIPVIVIICYLIGEIFKIFFFKKKRQYKFIPVVVGICGGILGFIIYLIYPEYIARHPLEAIAIGIISGLASTGSNQLWKQLLKKEEEK